MLNERFKVKTRTQKVLVSELLYVDNERNQQISFRTRFSSPCDKFGLTINLKKMVTVSQFNKTAINETTLDKVDKFKYLGSTLTKNTTIDQDISTRLGKASTTFGHQTKRV